MPLNPFAAQIAKHNTALPTLSDGDTHNLEVDSSGRLIMATSGNSISIDDNSGSITVDNAGTFAVQEDGAALTALQLIDDVVFAVDTAAGASDPGNNILAVRDDALGALTPAEGDYVSLRVDANGALWMKHDGDISIADGGNSITVDAVDLDIRDLAHTQDSVRIGDGTDLALVTAAGELNVLESNSANMLTALQLIDNIVAAEDAAAGDAFTGVPMLAVRQDTLASNTSADDDFAALKVNAAGELYVTGTFDVGVDDVFESGTEADGASDSAGDGAVALTDAAMADVATIAVGAGTTLFIVGMDFSADEQARFELIVDDNGTPAEWIRAGAVDGVTSHNKTFPRAIEITGAANREVQLRAQSLSASTANAAGAINAYTR